MTTTDTTIHSAVFIVWANYSYEGSILDSIYNDESMAHRRKRKLEAENERGRKWSNDESTNLPYPKIKYPGASISVTTHRIIRHRRRLP